MPFAFYNAMLYNGAVFKGGFMKKRILFFLFCTVAVFAGCKFEVPQKVSVKTNAEYNFSFGDALKFDFSKYFSYKDILDSQNSGSNFRVYDYNPGGNSEYQQFLIRIPIVEVPVDISSYLENLKISDDLRDFSFDRKIQIPAAALEINEDIDLSSMNDAVNAAITITGTTLGGKVEFAGGESTFSSVSYTSGKITLNSVSGQEISDGTVAYLYHSGDFITRGEFFGGTAILSLDEKTLYHDGMSISFDGSSSVGAYIGIISGTISKADGLKMEKIAVPVSKTASTKSDDASFEKLVVGKGEMTVGIDIPNSWKNVECDYTAVMTGAVAAVASTASPVCDLSGKEIKNEDTEITGAVSITLKDATVDFSKTPKIKAVTNIESIETASIKFADMKTSFGSTESLSDMVKKTVAEIKFEAGCGVSGTYVNTLPTGNDVEITVTSGFLGISGKQGTLLGGTESGELKILSDSGKTVVPETDSAVDFNVKIALPGMTEENPNLITVRDVVPGSEYQIALKLEPKIEWESVSLKTSELNTPAKDEAKTNLNLAEFFSSFADAVEKDGNSDIRSKISIPEIPLYLYFQFPDSLGNMEIGGSVTAKYGDKKTEILNGDETITKCCEPDFGNKDDSGAVLTDLSAAGFSKKIPNLFNEVDLSKEGSVVVDYDVKISGASGETMTIKRADMNSDAKSVSVSAVIGVPLKFGVKEKIDINLLKVAEAEKQEDFFGRSSATDISEIEKYLNVIESVGLGYDFSTLPFGGDIALSIDMDGDESQFDTKQIDISKGSEIVVSGSDIKNMLKTYPLYPSVSLSVNEGSFGLKRNLALNARLSLKMKTNGKIEIFENNK